MKKTKRKIMVVWPTSKGGEGCGCMATPQPPLSLEGGHAVSLSTQKSIIMDGFLKSSKIKFLQTAFKKPSIKK
jgi:hypothetical protein